MEASRIDRENEALNLLIASFFTISDGDDIAPLDDPAILSEEDHRAIDALGDDLVDRLLARSTADIPPDVLAELEQHRRDLIAEEEDEITWE